MSEQAVCRWKRDEVFVDAVNDVMRRASRSAWLEVWESLEPLFAKAAFVYFIGFGYDERNLPTRLQCEGLPMAPRAPNSAVLNALAPIVAALKTRQAEREQPRAAIAAAEAVQPLQVDRQTVERKEQVKRWRELLSAGAAERREFLRLALSGPIRFAPEGKRYRFRGRTVTGKLIAELVGLHPL